jgi:MoaA/NifB/PqqE/SkfB family radical SAM enzyme
MVSYATKHNIYSATSTNAHYLTDANCKKTMESGLSRRIISIDGVSQESYGLYRIGGKLDKVIDGTKNMVKWQKVTSSKTPFIIGSL